MRQVITFHGLMHIRITNETWKCVLPAYLPFTFYCAIGCSGIHSNYNMNTVCILFCFVTVRIKLILPISFRIWHWGNHMIAPVPEREPWRIWVNCIHRDEEYKTTKTKHIKTMWLFYVIYFMLCIANRLQVSMIYILCYVLQTGCKFLWDIFYAMYYKQVPSFYGIYFMLCISSRFQVSIGYILCYILQQAPSFYRIYFMLYIATGSKSYPVLS